MFQAPLRIPAVNVVACCVFCTKIVARNKGACGTDKKTFLSDRLDPVQTKLEK